MSTAHVLTTTRRGALGLGAGLTALGLGLAGLVTGHAVLLVMR